MLRGQEENLLHIAVAEIAVCGKHESRQAGDLRRGGRRSGKAFRARELIVEIVVRQILAGREELKGIRAVRANEVGGEQTVRRGRRIAARRAYKDASAGFAVACGPPV